MIEKQSKRLQKIRPPRSKIQKRLERIKAAAQRAHERNRSKLQAHNQKKKTVQKSWMFILLMTAVVLLVFNRCACTPIPLPPAPPPVPSKNPERIFVPAPLKPTEKSAPLERRNTLQRNSFELPKESRPEWFDEIRRQVAARSPRLAECLKGVPLPGGVRWSARFDPRSGLVSDQTLTPVSTTASLSPEEDACLVQVLSKPSFAALKTTAGLGSHAVPQQPMEIHMVIEF